MHNMNKRNENIDIIKGAAILLVLAGHAIQFGSGMHCYIYSDFFLDPVYRVIYSFHMPLFMLISGYLFYFTVNRHSFGECVKSRFQTLLLPIGVWSLIFYAERMIKGTEHTPWLAVRAYLSTCAGNFWFLWAIFYCSFAVLLTRRFLKDSIWVYMGILALSFFTPDLHRLHLYKFMYPYFVLGYLGNREYQRYRQKSGGDGKRAGSGRLPAIWAVSTALYLVLLAFHFKEAYVYISGYTLLGRKPGAQFAIDLYRFALGLSGCIAAAGALLWLTGRLPAAVRRTLSCPGRNSMGIYIISTLLFTYAVKPLAWELKGINYGYMLLETGAVLAVSLGLTVLIRKSALLNKILFGGR